MRTTVKILARTALLGMIIFSLGCTSFLVPSHPDKSKQEYHADKRECEQRAREYASTQQGMHDGDVDEIFFATDCLKQKGWKYFSWD